MSSPSPSWPVASPGRRRTLDPKLDVVFKMLFGDPRHQRLLVSLLEAVMQPATPITEVTVLNPGLPKDLAGDKDVELDVRVREGSGRQYDVEMQCAPPLAMAKRALFYWARMYGSELGVGQRYAELQPCVVIWFLAYSELETARLHSRYRLLETSDYTVFCDDLELHVVELPKLAQAAAGGDEPRLVAWSKFLAAMTDTELEGLAMADPELREAKEALERVSTDERARVTAQARELALISRQLDLTYARKGGLEEGRREGEAVGRRAVVALCEVLGVPLDQGRRRQLEAADATALSALLTALGTERAWPAASGRE